MKKPVFISLLILFLGGAVISGCGVGQPLQSKLPWIDRWLNNPVCSPPCWERITPGVSTAKESSEILAALPDVQQLWMPGNLTSLHIISWEMVGCASSTGGAINFDNFPNDTINWINLRLGCKDSFTTLQEIIDAFGTPEYAWAEWNTGGCTAKLLNIKQGMVISTYETGLIFRKLKPSSVITAILLFPPEENLEKTVKLLTFTHDVDIREWQGFSDPCVWR